MQDMINELNNFSKEIGLKIDTTKQIMTNASENINIILERTRI